MYTKRWSCPAEILSYHWDQVHRGIDTWKKGYCTEVITVPALHKRACVEGFDCQAGLVYWAGNLKTQKIYQRPLWKQKGNADLSLVSEQNMHNEKKQMMHFYHSQFVVKHKSHVSQEDQVNVERKQSENRQVHHSLKDWISNKTKQCYSVHQKICQSNQFSTGLINWMEFQELQRKIYVNHCTPRTTTEFPIETNL